MSNGGVTQILPLSTCDYVNSTPVHKQPFVNFILTLHLPKLFLITP